MATEKRSLWQTLVGSGDTQELPPEPALPLQTPQVETPAVGIAPDDPIIALFLRSPGVVQVDKLTLDSPAVRMMKEVGVKLTIPLVSQGELVGVINMGPRLSEQEYSSDDRRLLANLATQAAPALRVAQLARQQQVEARERERIEQELRVASLIQQTLLPEQVPQLDGWDVAAHYQPARAVGGDFYDFLYFPDGRVGLVIGDVTDKGVPAAMVMATTRSMLRAAAERLQTPGAVLRRVNGVLVDEIPPKMFVTCLYALLEPATGRLLYANAGHDVPYQRTTDGVAELRATGMPLGLMPEMEYEEKEVTLAAGDSVLFYSDGLVEAHNPVGDMYGFPRLREQLAGHPGGVGLIEYLLGELRAFTGPDWEQEDDATFVVLQRTAHAAAAQHDAGRRTLAEFELPSAPGNERQAMERVATAVEGLGLPGPRLERLKTAVAESTMNAMEHGNEYDPGKPVKIQVLASDESLVVRIRDQGGGQPIPDAATPDIEAKLAGEQSPRGWGLFLIKNMVDEMRTHADGTHHTIELQLDLAGGRSADTRD